MKFFCSGGGGSQYLVWPPFASRNATHLVSIELIRLLIVACGLLVHSSSMAEWSCWILAGTGTRCRVRRSRVSQTCSMGDMSVEYAAMQELGCFQLPEIVYISFQHGAMHYHAATRVDGHGWMAKQWASGSRHGNSVHSKGHQKMHLCSLSITYACPYHNSTTTMGHSIHNVDLSKPLSHTMPYTLSAICPVQLISETDSCVNRTPLQSVRCYRMWAFAHSSRFRQRTAVKSRPRWGRRACKWASLRQFLTVCAEIIWLCKPIVAAAVRVAGLIWSWRWRCWMWRSWAGVVTHSMRLWGRLDALPNTLKCLWRWLLVEKWRFNS